MSVETIFPFSPHFQFAFDVNGTNVRKYDTHIPVGTNQHDYSKPGPLIDRFQKITLHSKKCSSYINAL